MVMIRPKGKATKIARKVLGSKGVVVPKASQQKKTPQTPFLQH
jgi:hypothetical protein